MKNEKNKKKFRDMTYYDDWLKAAHFSNEFLHVL